MKYVNQLFFIPILLIASCSSNNGKSVNKDSVKNFDTSVIAKTANPSVISSLCFLRTEGKSNQDSTSIEFVIKNNKITGQMNWMPDQKDSRKGTLKGIVKGNIINAVWSFMQEGTMDTLNLKFLLKNNELSQKPLKINVKTGRDQTDESAGYTLTYQESSKVHH